MRITLEQLCKAAPVTTLRAAQFIDALNKAMEEFEINTPLRQAAFLAQICHESGNLTRLEENLNYKPEAILSTFNNTKITRFTKAMAQLYGRTDKHPANQKMIASIAYANRMGNGDVASGEGYKHRGLGLLQTTGKTNQYRVAMYFDVDPEKIHEWLITPEGACRSAGLYWKDTGLNKHADKGDLDAVSDLINIGLDTAKEGDAIGYKHRKELYEAFKRVLGRK